MEYLRKRFEKNKHRHPDLAWEVIAATLKTHPTLTKVVEAMEETGGEPDVVEVEPGVWAFVDCAAESPKGRRSLCYDRTGLESRKDFPPKGTALEHAAELGITMLNPEQYERLQAVGPFDQKTSSWLLTPKETRKHGGALFGDYRYGRSFVYHNGAGSYYAARGYRGYMAIPI